MNIEKAKSVEGWMSEKELEVLASFASRATRCLELGSWKGRSSRAIADNLPPGSTLVCVDHFNGSALEPDMQAIADGGQAFRTNMADHLASGRVSHFDTVAQVAAVFDSFDFIFIDAGHTYAEVKADIAACYPLLANGGVFCGHDYLDHGHTVGVKQAVDEAFKTGITVRESIWFAPRMTVSLRQFLASSTCKEGGRFCQGACRSIHESGKKWRIEKTGQGYFACPHGLPMGWKRGVEPIPMPEKPKQPVFDGVYCINLDRRPDRWEAFKAMIQTPGWAWGYVERVEAVDGKGDGAKGCRESHLKVLQLAKSRGQQKILVFEDDAYLIPGWQEAMGYVEAPESWDLLYLGGQYRDNSIQRTHAVAYDVDMLLSVLTPGRMHGHIDHRLGELQKSGMLKYYAPPKWIFGQSAGQSDISGKKDSDRTWARPVHNGLKNKTPYHVIGDMAILEVPKCGSETLRQSGGVRHENITRIPPGVRHRIHPVRHPLSRVLSFRAMQRRPEGAFKHGDFKVGETWEEYLAIIKAELASPSTDLHLRPQVMFRDARFVPMKLESVPLGKRFNETVHEVPPQEFVDAINALYAEDVALYRKARSFEATIKPKRQPQGVIDTRVAFACDARKDGRCTACKTCQGEPRCEEMAAWRKCPKGKW